MNLIHCGEGSFTVIVDVKNLAFSIRSRMCTWDRGLCRLSIEDNLLIQAC